MTRLFVLCLVLLSLLAFERAVAVRLPKQVTMSPASQSDSTKRESTSEIIALVNRQVQAWEKNNFAIASVDWLPTGELVSPGGHVAAKDMQAAMTDYFTHFGDARITVKNVFLSPDGNKAAIEWDWEVTRLRDKAHGVTHDAIIVDLKGGKISSWREYFDFGDSVDAKP